MASPPQWPEKESNGGEAATEEERKNVIAVRRAEEKDTEEEKESGELVFSWFGKSVKGCKIWPKIRDQNEVSSESCAHHSLATVVEVRAWLRWLLEVSVEFYEARSGYSVDVAALFNLCPDLRDPGHIVERVVDCNFGVLDVKEPFSEEDKFKLSSIFVVLRQPLVVDMQGMSDQEKFPLVLKMVDVVSGLNRIPDKGIGPIVAGFLVSVNYDPSKQMIYTYDGRPRTVDHNGEPIDAKHLVSVIGVIASSSQDGTVIHCEHVKCTICAKWCDIAISPKDSVFI